MAVRVSDRLRDAFERLDQAIDRLQTQTAALEAAVEVADYVEAPASDDNSANAVIAERLDKMIEQIELALAG